MEKGESGGVGNREAWTLTILPRKFGSFHPQIPRLSQHRFRTGQGPALPHCRHGGCRGGSGPGAAVLRPWAPRRRVLPLRLQRLWLLPGGRCSARRAARLPPDVIRGPLRHSFRSLRALASRPGRQPRSFLPSARPSERRRPAGSLKRRRLLSPPPPRRSLPLCSLRRSLHVKPPEWSQGEVGNAATYGRACRSAPAQRGKRRGGLPSGAPGTSTSLWACGRLHSSWSMNGKSPLCGRPETKAASGRCENATQVLAQVSASSPCCMASQARAPQYPQLKDTLCPGHLNFFSSKKGVTKSVYHFKLVSLSLFMVVFPRID